MSRAHVDTPMTCRELVELVTDYVEGGLATSDRKRFETHIGECDPCAAYLEQIRLLVDASGRLSEEQLDPEARDELLIAFRSWKKG
jgi:anti-sigma factor RsiW